MSKFPPYYITFTPSSGTTLSSTDISTTILNYGGFKVARYFFIELNTQSTYMNYAEIEIYDENGTNVALNLGSNSYAQYTTVGGYPASNAFDDNLNNFQHTLNTANATQWLGVDLGGDKKIAGIRVYGRNGTDYIEGGSYYSRTAYFSIYLYTASEYSTTKWTNNDGPIDEPRFSLHTLNATKTEIINNNQQVFYYGIVPIINSNITYESTDIDNVKSIVVQPPPEYTFNASSGTMISHNDVTNTLNEYTGLFIAIMGSGVARFEDGGLYQGPQYGVFENTNVIDISFANVTQIGQYAFKECTHLDNVIIPNSLTLGWNTSSIFYRTRNMSSCILNNNIGNSFGSSCFQDSGLTSIEIPDCIGYLNGSVFQDCRRMTSCTFGVNSGLKQLLGSDFNGCYALTSITIPKSVTKINSQAFYNCVSLGDVTFHKYPYDNTGNNVINLGGFGASLSNGVYTTDVFDYIKNDAIFTIFTDEKITISSTGVNDAKYRYHIIGTSIAANAFENQTDLLSVVIPNSVTEIGNVAFDGTSNMTSCTLPTNNNNFKIIPGYCFENSGLTSIDIPDSVTKINSRAFNSCSSLETVNLGNSLIVIFTSGFNSCSSLTSITIPDSLTNIYSYAFYNCSSLKTVNLGNGVKYLSSYSFEMCSSLTSITIPTSVLKIEGSVFKKCSSLTSVTIGNSVTSIGSYCFLESGLTSINIPTNIPTINEQVFYMCSSLTSVTIPDSVTRIQDHAFEQCSSLTSISIPNSVTRIDDAAFKDCSALNDITLHKYPGDSISNTVIVLDGGSLSITGFYTTNVFENIKNDVIFTIFTNETFTISGVTAEKYRYHLIGTSIAADAFKDQTDLLSVVIPDSVTTIGLSAFNGCSSLETVDLGNSVERIVTTCFYSCSSLASITIPDSLTDIGSSAFFNCSSLETVNLGNGVKYLRSGSFESCSSLTSITIPNSVLRLESSVFKKCSSLTSVTFGNSIISFGFYCFQESGLTSINIPTTIQIINQQNFYMCSSLTSVTIPDSVIRIGDLAFEKCSSLTSISIPDSVTEIGEAAFKDCSALNDITLHKYPGDSTSNTVIVLDGGSLSNGVYTTNAFDNIKDDVIFTIFTDETMTISSTVSSNGSTDAKYSYHIIDGTTSIAADAFKDRTDLLSVDISNSVTEIGNNAFEGTSAMTSCTFTVTSTLATIGEYGFYKSGLLSINIPDSVSSIGQYAFGGDASTSLTSCTLPNNNNFKIIPERCFYYSGLTSITIPSNVTEISTGAFFHTDISSNPLVLPDSVNTIGTAAFSSCHKIKSYTLPDNPHFKIIPQSCFFSNSGLLSITIPDSVTEIGYSAFGHCDDLSSISIPNSVTSIGQYAFWSTDNLTSCTLPTNSDFKIIPKYCFKESGLTSITIPNSVTELKSYAFQDCTSLTGFTLPNNPNFTTIGEYCFYRSLNWTSTQSIPQSVTFIGNYAFHHNANNHQDNNLTKNVYLKLPEAYINDVGRGIESVSSSSIFATNSTTRMGLLYNHFDSYKFTNSSNAVFQLDYSGTSNNQIDFDEYKIHDISLQYFRKGIVNETYYNYTLQSNTMMSSYNSYPYAVAGPIGYKWSYGDIGRRIAPYYTIYYNNTSNVKLIPGWKRLGLLVIGGGGGGGAGGVYGNYGGYKGGGSGGGSGGIGLGMLNRNDFTNLNELNIIVAAGGTTYVAGDNPYNGAGGHKHGYWSAANGRKGGAGNFTSISYTNNTELIKAWGGGGGTGGFAYISPDHWEWQATRVRGEYWNTDGSGGLLTNNYYFSGGAAGFVTKYNNVTLQTNVGSSNEGVWMDDLPQDPINGSNTNSYGRSNGANGGVVDHKFNIFDNSYGKGGNGGNEGEHHGSHGSAGLAVVIQYFT